MIVPSAAKIAKKWGRVTPERTIDYEEGVRNPLKDWATETKAAEPRYEEGVKAAIARKSFGKGVDRVVRGAEDDMRKGMERVVKVLEGITLPQRYPTGDPRNIERVKVIQQALHKMKIGA